KRVLRRLLLLGASLLLDQSDELFLERSCCVGKRGQRRVLYHAGARCGRQIEEWCVHDPLQATVRPRAARERLEVPDRGQDTRSIPVEADTILWVRFVQVEFDIHLAVGGRNNRQVVQQPARELPRLDRELLTRLPIDDLDLHPCRADALAELRGEIPLHLLAGELADPREEWLDAQSRPALRAE